MLQNILLQGVLDRCFWHVCHLVVFPCLYIKLFCYTGSASTFPRHRVLHLDFLRVLLLIRPRKRKFLTVHDLNHCCVLAILINMSLLLPNWTSTDLSDRVRATPHIRNINVNNSIKSPHIKEAPWICFSGRLYTPKFSSMFLCRIPNWVHTI